MVSYKRLILNALSIIFIISPVHPCETIEYSGGKGSQSRGISKFDRIYDGFETTGYPTVTKKMLRLTKPKTHLPHPDTEDSSSSRRIADEDTVEITQISVKKTPSIFKYAIDDMHMRQLGEKSWRVYTAEEQSFESLPEEIQRTARPWYSPPSDNIYATYVFDWPKPLIELLTHITQVTSISVSQTMERYGLLPQIKWPNDVLLDNKKVCGIGGTTSFNLEDMIVYVNIGINVNMTIDECSKVDQPATSMSIEKNGLINKADILDSVTKKLCENVHALWNEGFQNQFLPYLNSHIAYLNQEVIFHPLPDVTQEVFFKGLDKSGMAILIIDGVEDTIAYGRIRPKNYLTTSANEEPKVSSSTPLLPYLPLTHDPLDFPVQEKSHPQCSKEDNLAEEENVAEDEAEVSDLSESLEEELEEKREKRKKRHAVSGKESESKRTTKRARGLKEVEGKNEIAVSRSKRWQELAQDKPGEISGLPKELKHFIQKHKGKNVQSKFGRELAHKPKKSATQGNDYSEALPKLTADHRGLQHRFLKERKDGTKISKPKNSRDKNQYSLPKEGDLPK